MRGIREAILIFAAASLAVAALPHAEPSFRDAVLQSEGDDELRREWLDKVDEARKRYDIFAASARLAQQDAVSYLRASHLDDSTLRAGDIVVTETGLLLFTGSQTSPHESCDFERVGETRARTLPHRNALLEILRATERRGAPP